MPVLADRAYGVHAACHRSRPEGPGGGPVRGQWAVGSGQFTRVTFGATALGTGRRVYGW